MRVLQWQSDVTVANVEELARWADEELAPRWTGRDLVLLEGPMGVGKTQMTRLIAQSLGDPGDVASPTFAIHHHYRCARQTMDHLDLYRIENEEDLESTGFWDLFAQEQGMVVVEWADRLDVDSLPRNWSLWIIRLAFAAGEDGSVAGTRRRVSLRHLGSEI